MRGARQSCWAMIPASTAGKAVDRPMLCADTLADVGAPARARLRSPAVTAPARFSAHAMPSATRDRG